MLLPLGLSEVSGFSSLLRVLGVWAKRLMSSDCIRSVISGTSAVASPCFACEVMIRF